MPKGQHRKDSPIAKVAKTIKAAVQSTAKPKK